jgi:hypothetical protein
MRFTFTLVLGLSFHFLSLADSATFQTKEGKVLQDPVLIRTYKEKAFVAHADGVDSLEQTPDVVDFFNIKATAPTQTVSFINKEKIETWLIDIEKSAKGSKQTVSTKPQPTPTPQPSLAPKKMRSTFTASAFAKEYESSTYDGQRIEISGTITSILGFKSPYTIILDDVISLTYTTTERVTARDMEGNPKSIGTLENGGNCSLSGTCLGINSDGYISLKVGNLIDPKIEN